MLFGNWRWCLARRRCHSTCPSARHIDGRSQEWWVRCHSMSSLRWKRVRRSVDILLWCLAAVIKLVHGSLKPTASHSNLCIRENYTCEFFARGLVGRCLWWFSPFLWEKVSWTILRGAIFINHDLVLCHER